VIINKQNSMPAIAAAFGVLSRLWNREPSSLNGASPARDQMEISGPREIGFG
jgi:hypothetical protein